MDLDLDLDSNVSLDWILDLKQFMDLDFDLDLVSDMDSNPGLRNRIRTSLLAILCAPATRLKVFAIGAT